MFPWKKKTTPRPAYPPALPPPILRTPADRPISPTRIRFRGHEASQSSPRPLPQPSPQPSPQPPRLVVSSYEDSESHPVPSRRSSRPPSPISTSFGSRSGPPNVTTPPTIYVSSMQAPPSPYRPTTEHRERTGLPARRISEIPMASRPARHSSLFTGTSEVPQLNIIPATPQDSAEGFSSILSASPPPPERVEPTSPTLDVELEFTPFAPLVPLPTSQSELTVRPPSPPPSHASLPSLTSSDSIHTEESTISASSSVSSLMSFPDLEAALGSMLASLEPDIEPPVEKNPGLGLGLDLPDPPSITAPLTKLRKAPPPPLDLDSRVSHRVAFYKTAKAAPNTPSSGVFVQSASPLSSLGSANSAASWHSLDETRGLGLGLGLDNVFGETSFARRRSVSEPYSCRDSISLASEASDEDLHTASIISLAPMPDFGEARLVEREEMLAFAGVVGLAL